MRNDELPVSSLSAENFTVIVAIADIADYIISNRKNNHEERIMAEAKLHLTDHPLIWHKISLLRSKDTDIRDFRRLVREIALLIACEATRDLPLADHPVTPPITETVGKHLAQRICLVPILRAGLGMVDGLLDLLPMAQIGHIGLYRDPKTLAPVEYYCKFPPDIAERWIQCSPRAAVRQRPFLSSNSAV